jgi:hypothetical protein
VHDDFNIDLFRLAPHLSAAEISFLFGAPVRLFSVCILLGALKLQGFVLEFHLLTERGELPVGEVRADPRRA